MRQAYTQAAIAGLAAPSFAESPSSLCHVSAVQRWMRADSLNVCYCESQDQRPDHAENELEISIHYVCRVLSDGLASRKTVLLPTLRPDVREYDPTSLDELKCTIDILCFLYPHPWIRVVPSQRRLRHDFLWA